jgi:hypothetical protein
MARSRVRPTSTDREFDFWRSRIPWAFPDALRPRSNCIYMAQMVKSRPFRWTWKVSPESGLRFERELDESPRLSIAKCRKEGFTYCTELTLFERIVTTLRKETGI